MIVNWLELASIKGQTNAINALKAEHNHSSQRNLVGVYGYNEKHL
jgi:hypothetical protein